MSVPPLRYSILIALVATILISALSFSSGGGIPNSDDILRGVTVDDLLAGQSWFDPQQYRLGLERGTLMHWSRLVDAPIAAIKWVVLAMSGNQSMAQQAANVIWPAFTFFAAMMGALFACRRLERADMIGPTAIVASIAFMTVGVFGYGALDHHNIQVALGVWLIALLIPSADSERAHGFAGLVAVFMLAIGMETLPYVTVAGLWVAVGLLFGFVSAKAARSFGLALGISSLIVFVLTVAPSAYSTIYCDAYSSFHIGMCVTGGFGLALASHFGATFKARLAGLAFVAIIVVGLLATVFSTCLTNPLSQLDPKLRIFWLDGVVETRSIFDLWSNDPFAVFGLFGMACFGFGVCIYLAAKRSAHVRQFAMLSAVMLFAAIGVTAWQQRGMMFGAAFAVLPLSFVLAELRAKYQTTNAVGDLLKMAAFGILALNMTWWIAGANAASLFATGPTLHQQIAAAQPRDYCYGADVYQHLANEPKGVVLGATDIGASILAFTHHRALAGPYHRNVDGNLAMIETMIAAPQAARQRLAAAGVTIIADCIKSVDAQDFKKAASSGLQAQLHRRHIPDWLEPIDATIDEPLVLYRVKPVK